MPQSNLVLARSESRSRKKKYWYYLASLSLVLDHAYLSDTLRLTFLVGERASDPSSRGGGSA